MQRQNYMITAEEVAQSMGISLGYSYKLLRKLNKELADQGYVTVAGKIPRAFWEKKFYGYSQSAMQGGESMAAYKDEERGTWYGICVSVREEIALLHFCIYQNSTLESTLVK